MRLRPLHKLLLAAALVFGQGLAIAHDYQHAITSTDQPCEACVHGHSFQPVTTAAVSLSYLDLAHEAPALYATRASQHRHRHDYPIRAPPSSHA